MTGIGKQSNPHREEFTLNMFSDDDVCTLSLARKQEGAGKWFKIKYKSQTELSVHYWTDLLTVNLIFLLMKPLKLI